MGMKTKLLAAVLVFAVLLVGASTAMASSATPQAMGMDDDMDDEEKVNMTANNTELEDSESEHVGPAGPMGPVGPAEKHREKMMEIREKYRERVEKYKEMKYKYEKAREEYLKIKEKGRDLRGKDMETAKRFVHSGIDMGIVYLQRLKIYVETTPRISDESRAEIVEQIDEYISELQEKIDKITAAETPEELREAVKELRKSWREIRKGIKGIVGQVAVARIETVLDRAELVQERLQDRIDALQEAGYDTTELELILEDYSQKLELARGKLGLAKEAFKEIKDAENADELFGEGNQFMGEVHKYLREAFGDIKEFIKELKQYRIKEGKIFFGNATGEVWAKGEGVAKIRGDAIVHVRGNVTLEVTPASAVIKVVGFGNVTTEDDKAIYTGEGNAVIRGKNITVKIEGYDFKLYAKGKGSLDLEGKGYYRVKKLPQDDMTDEIEFEGIVPSVDFGGE